MNIETKFYTVLSQLSHDLKNNFILIRAAAESIKKNSPPSEVIDKKVVTINQSIDQAIARFETAYALLLSIEMSTSNEK